MKNLSDYIDSIKALVLESSLNGDPEISGVTNDSRKVGDGSIFIAIEGAKSDGHDFIDTAVNRGAAVIVHSKDISVQNKNMNSIRVSDAYSAYSLLSECFFDFPSRSLRLSGITGTNGKTTSAFILNRILDSNSAHCGLITTVKYFCGDKYIEASRTTPEAYELQSLFAEMRRNGCSDVVMEVSSHGLHQNRTASAKFHTAIFTNLTGDHLDYHIDMESYFQAKKMLFTDCLHENGTAVINIDDPYGQRLADELSGKKIMSFGMNKGCFCRIKYFSNSAKGSEFTLEIDKQDLKINSIFIGEHNAYNIAGAVTAAYALGKSPEEIAEAFKEPFNVPGRLESFPAPWGASFFVDYAHTDDALENVLKCLKPLTEGRLITVFGCGGDRDRTKRPRMAAAAAKYSDIVIVTSDNPRTEKPEKIIDDILEGLPAGCDYLSISSRRDAIGKAVEISGEGDIILIAGKGHETYQEINGSIEDFDDRKEVLSAISLRR